MTKTEHYQLNQWEPADKLSRADFNADNAAIDATLAANAKALSDYQTANDAAVAKKAETSTVTALAANLGSVGKNCRFAVGSYTGDKSYGAGSPNELSFDFVPYLVIVYSDYGGMEMVLVRPNPRGGGVSNGAYIYVTWGSKSVSWYSTSSSDDQQNYSHTYYYIALGADE